MLNESVASISSLLAVLGLPGGWEWIVLLVIGLLIFGRRLPEVGRSLGRSIVEFKKGIKGVGDEIETESSRSETKQLKDERRPTLPEESASRTASEATKVRVERTREEA